MLKTLSLSTSLLFLLAACGEPEEEKIAFSDDNLSGTVNGEPWEFVGGATDAFISDDDGFFTSFFNTAPAEGEDVCDQFGFDSPTLLSNLPTETGEFKFGFRRNLTFTYEDEEGQIQNDVALDDGIRIDEIDEDAGVIKGAVKASTNGHEVDGTFEIKICPEEE